METKIIFSLDLSLDTAAFIENWNADPACQPVAAARLETIQHKGMFNLSLADGVITLIGTLTVGIATNALYDLIKSQIVKQGVRVETEYMELTQPDGTKLVVVKKKEN